MENAQDEIDNLRILVDLVLNRIKREARDDKFDTVEQLLWYVPINILTQYIEEG